MDPLTPLQNTSNPPKEPLSDPIDIKEAAQNIGLKQVPAWIQADLTVRNKRSPGAARVRQSREKSEKKGVRQLSVSIPIELHDPIKDLATRTRAGEPADKVIAELLSLLTGKQTEPSPQPAQSATNVATSLLQGIPLWRRWVIGMLLPRKVREAGRIESLKEPTKWWQFRR